jgi:hypothetical protein
MSTNLWPALPISWRNPPARGERRDDGFDIEAGPMTDLFFDPNGAVRIDNSPQLLFAPPAGDFVLSARVRVAFAADYDAGALLARAGHDRWAKLCFEYSPQGQPMIVSVVNKGLSDDCNGQTIDGDSVWLRLARVDRALAFHYSTDGALWRFARYLPWDEPDARFGLTSQSPRGQRCLAEFSNVTLVARTVRNLRDGT